MRGAAAVGAHRGTHDRLLPQVPAVTGERRSLLTCAVLVFGLLAFVVRRLAPPGLARQLAIPAAVVIIAAEAFDRLYLGVHWQSDVLGGLLLGGLALAAAIAWLDWGSAH